MSGVEAIKEQDRRERASKDAAREEGERFIKALESIARSLERISCPPVTITLKEPQDPFLEKPYSPPPPRWTFTKDINV